jgi:hypothetical protein
MNSRHSSPIARALTQLVISSKRRMARRRQVSLSHSSATRTLAFRTARPAGTKAFESAVELMNRSKQRPDFVLFIGDLTLDVPNRDVHAQRMQLFK